MAIDRSMRALVVLVVFAGSSVALAASSSVALAAGVSHHGAPAKLLPDTSYRLNRVPAAYMPVGHQKDPVDPFSSMLLG